MPSNVLTKKEFQITMSKLMGLVATKDDIGSLVVELKTIRKRIDELMGSVDSFSGHQSKDHDELIVLRARYDRLARTLVSKHIVTESEVAL